MLIIYKAIAATDLSKPTKQVFGTFLDDVAVALCIGPIAASIKK